MPIRGIYSAVTLPSSYLLSSNNTLLHQMAQADIRLARNKSSWSCQVLTAIQEIPDAQQFAEAVRTCKEVNMDMFEKVLYNHGTAVWRLLDGVIPQEAHSSCRIMRTYHSNFGIPLGTRMLGCDKKEQKAKLT